MDDFPILPDEIKDRIVAHLRRLYIDQAPCPFCEANLWALGLAEQAGYIARTCQQCGTTYLIDPTILGLRAVWYAPLDGRAAMRVLLDKDDPRIDAPVSD